MVIRYQLYWTMCLQENKKSSETTWNERRYIFIMMEYSSMHYCNEFFISLRMASNMNSIINMINHIQSKKTVTATFLPPLLSMKNY